MLCHKPILNTSPTPSQTRPGSTLLFQPTMGLPGALAVGVPETALGQQQPGP